MKHIIAEAAMLILLVCFRIMPAGAEIPEGLVIQGAWMAGNVTTRYAAGTEHEREEKIRIDCPLPQGEYTGEIYTLRSRSIRLNDVRQALGAAGQNFGGKIAIGRDGVRYVHTEQIDPHADLTREEAERQAVEVGLEYFAALGVEVAPMPSKIERPYDFDAYIEDERIRLSHMYSNPSAMLEQKKAQWKRTRKYEMREAAYTRVDFDIMADGMRMWRNPSYPAGYADEPGAWIGFDVSASVLVSDSGVLVEAWASHVPEIVSRRQPEEGELERFAALLDAQLSLPLVLAESWEDALNLALSGTKKAAVISANQEEHLYQSRDMDEPVTAYGSRSVVTSIYPCLTTISENEWAMLWRIETRQEFTDGWRY